MGTVSQVEECYLGGRECIKLIRKLTKHVEWAHLQDPFDVVVYIARGGRQIGKRIARRLQIPVRHVTISRYHGRVNIHHGTYRICDWKNPLVVDDVVDDGITLRLFYNHFGPATTASLYYKLGTLPRPAYFAALKPNKWIVFPWEKD